MTTEDLETRQRVLSLLRRHGWNATSFQVLEPGFRYFFDGDDACVAHVDTGWAWVAAGAPIAPAERLGAVAASFAAAARAAGRRACFFATEERFAQRARVRVLPVGEQPTWDPADWPASVRASQNLREQLRRARAKGVVVRLLRPDELADRSSPLRSSVDALANRWLGGRPMAPMGFLVDLELFSFPEERRVFVAEREGTLVGVLAAVPVYARNGWLFEDLLRDADAPNGTAELLIDAAMRHVADEGARYATLGLAPLAGALGRPLRMARAATSALFDFRGLRAFKAKLRPTHWEPIHLAFPEGAWATLAFADVLAAFARGSFARFGLETLLRGPAFVVRTLAALLAPWTVALALADTDRWFPAPWVHRAWVGFDAVLAVALFALAAHWRRGLALAVATVVSLDAIVTTAEAAVYNLGRTHGLVDAAVLGVACLAPTVAVFILWGAIGHRART